MGSLTICQLNLESTRPNGLMGYKVPTDLIKIIVKEPMHMGFYYRNQWAGNILCPTLKW